MNILSVILKKRDFCFQFSTEAQCKTREKRLQGTLQARRTNQCAVQNQFEYNYKVAVYVYPHSIQDLSKRENTAKVTHEKRLQGTLQARRTKQWTLLYAVIWNICKIEIKNWKECLKR